MSLFDKMKEPVFLKESSDAERQMGVLRELEPFLNTEGKALIKQDMKALEYGIAGEKNIAFELKNSHMPMYILHDIYLEDGDLSAQIDYLVFTKKICFVIESKNLYGNIEINNAGDFIRTIEYGGRKKKEGIYSPITQNQRHLELMKKIKTDEKNNFITKFMTGKYFEDCNKSIVVLANSRTVLEAKNAKRDVREKVIRADQLVACIKDMYKQSKESEVSEDRLLTWAKSYLELHRETQRDYLDKYAPYRMKEKALGKSSAEPLRKPVEKMPGKPADAPSKEVQGGEDESELWKELKAYRLQKSRDEKIKPYFLYNDSQLQDLISKMPRTKTQLKEVSGFGEVKTNKYGDDILRIVGEYIE